MGESTGRSTARPPALTDCGRPRLRRLEASARARRERREDRDERRESARRLRGDAALRRRARVLRAALGRSAPRVVGTSARISRFPSSSLGDDARPCGARCPAITPARRGDGRPGEWAPNARATASAVGEIRLILCARYCVGQDDATRPAEGQFRGACNTPRKRHLGVVTTTDFGTGVSGDR